MNLIPEIRKQRRAEDKLIDQKRLSPEQWAELSGLEGRNQAARNRIVFRLTGHLMRKGLDPGLVLHLMQSWDITRHIEPLGLERVAEIVDRVAEREAARLRGETT
jgi:hypothetical protein